MKKNIIIYLTIIGLFGLLSGCEKDGTKVVMLTSPNAPTIKTLPDLTLQRLNGTNILEFVGTPVDPGFQASATYFLEAAAAGTSFADAVILYSGVQDAKISMTVSDLNGMLLKKLPADQVSSVDFRIRSVLVQDAGTGYTPKVYISATKTADVTLYGLPRLDLIGSGVDQKIESALGNGIYAGFVKLDATKSFTLKDPDANIVYGGAAGILAVNGAAITSEASGWYQFSANTTALTYSMSAYMIGLVGSASANGWNSPDTKMDYDSKSGTWYITTDLIVGEIKFRFNDGWAWNLGWNDAKDALTHNGANIAVTEAGNYTITLTITKFDAPEAGTFTIVKN
ncbi:MAG: SusE domain-containing protein [Bacteroidota bacterium]